MFNVNKIVSHTPITMHRGHSKVYVMIALSVGQFNLIGVIYCDR